MNDWSQGTPLAYARELCRYWLDEYDWAKAQARLNRFPEFRTTIDGLEIHFIHVRSPYESAVPGGHLFNPVLITMRVRKSWSRVRQTNQS